jgi:hypothetical protein
MRISAFVIAFILSMAGLPTAQEFAEYVNTRDGFKIDFPGQPMVTDITWKLQQSYMLPGRVYAVDKGREHYAVTVVDYGGIEKMAIARANTCVSGDRPLCRGTDVSGPGVWKHDVREAVLFATLKFLQRDNAKVSDLTWSQHDLVEGNELQLTNTADQSRTYAHRVARNEAVHRRGDGAEGSPPATLFQTSMGWVDKNGKGIRYQDMYIGAVHSMRVYPVPAVAGAPAPAARSKRNQRASHASGLNAALGASRLKCVLCTNGSRRFSESVISATTVNHTSPFGAVMRW